MGASVNTEVIDFTGGMHTVKAPHMIAQSECRAMINVDIRQGSLLSIPQPRNLEQGLASHFIQFNGSLYYYDDFRSNAILNNNLYWANGVDSGKIMWDGRELSLGIPTPSHECDITATNVGAGEHTGDFKYTYTFYDTSTGAESAPAPLPPYLTVDGDDIIVSGMEALPTEADRYRIYRIGGYLPRFTMVAEIENTETPYTDKLDDTEIDGRLMYTLRSGAPIAGVDNFVELGGRLYGSVGSKVYFSALGNPDAWYASDFFTMPTDITGMAKSPAGLLVMGKAFIYLLVGNQPSNFQLKVISSILGCESKKSIAYLGENAIWLGEDGIYTSNGYNIINLTGNKIKDIADIMPTSAMVVNEVYYLHYKPQLTPSEELFPSDTLYPAGALGVNEIEDGIITIDFKRGNGYSYEILDFQGLASIGVKDGNPHCITSIANVIFLSCEDPIECDEYLQCSQYDLNLLGDRHYDDFAKLNYVSPQFIDGSFSTLKQYEKVRINGIGKFNIKVIFSNGEIAVESDVNIRADESIEELLTGEEISFDRDSVFIIGIPNNNNNSYSIGFIIEGVGIIKSIQYSWKPREIS